MMKTTLALLSLLSVLFVPLRVAAWGTSNTWVSNLSSRGITASTTYDFLGYSDFTNSKIPAGQADHDQYDESDCSYNVWDNTPVKIEIWVDSSLAHQNMSVACDQSIVAFDSPDGNSVDVYTSVYGHINQPDGALILVLAP